MFYWKFVLQFLWLLACAAFGLALCVVMFKHPDVDHWFARVYSWGALKLAGLRLEIEGRIDPSRPAIYVANHQSGLDMMTFGALYPRRTVVIGKKELLYIPLFGFFYWAAGNILLNRRRSVRAVAELKRVTAMMRRRGLSAWIFPEGTRNAGRAGLLPFKKGAFHMAIEAGYPIVPIVCAPIGPVVSWKDRRFSGGTIPIRVLPGIPTEGCSAEDLPRLLEEVRSRMTAAVLELRARVSPGSQGPSRRKGRAAGLGWAGLAFIGSSWGCSSAPKDLRWTGRMYPSTLMVRRTPNPPARPTAMYGEPEFRSDPPPDARYDCEPAASMWKGMDFRKIRECLSTVNATQSRLAVRYRLVREPAPYLAPEDPEATPACLKEALPRIPVPREIFFQTQLPEGGGRDRLTCVDARLPLEDDELWGWKLPIGKLDLELVFPRTDLPSNDDETRILLQGWGLRLLRDSEHQGRFPVKIVPDFLCRRCLGRERWLQPQDPLPPLWP